MLKNLKCFLCGEDLHYANYKMIAFEKPYLNVFLCEKCKNNIEEVKLKVAESYYKNENTKKYSKNVKK